MRLRSKYLYFSGVPALHSSVCVSKNFYYTTQLSHPVGTGFRESSCFLICAVQQQQSKKGLQYICSPLQDHSSDVANVDVR